MWQRTEMKKGMAIHSSILAWRSPWMEDPGRLQSVGLQKVRHDWAPNTDRGDDRGRQWQGQAWIRGCQECSGSVSGFLWLKYDHRVRKLERQAGAGSQGLKHHKQTRGWAGHDGNDDNEKAFTKEEFKPTKVSELRLPKLGRSGRRETDQLHSFLQAGIS